VISKCSQLLRPKFMIDVDANFHFTEEKKNEKKKHQEAIK
jgi:hypothetical protein